MFDDFEVVGEITNVEVIAVNMSIRERNVLRANFGGKRWRKMKGVARVRVPSGDIRTVELHWYEAHGVGRKKMKVKRPLD